MIIAFEGLSCAGKSAITTELKRTSEDWALISEFIVDTSEGITTEICKVNDIAKSNYAILLQEQAPIVLMDRSFLSTLVYTYAEGMQKYKDTTDWYVRALQKGLINAPDLYVYLRIQPEQSIQRARSVNRYDEMYAWYNNVTTAYEHYENIFQSKIVDKPYKVVDVDDLSFKDAVTKIAGILRELGE